MAFLGIDFLVCLGMWGVSQKYGRTQVTQKSITADYW